MLTVVPLVDTLASSRCAMVFGHPAHELPAMGLIQRFRPHILFLTRADSAGEQEREAFARRGLAQLCLEGSATFLGTPEAEVFRWLLETDMTAALAARAQILDWLDATRPDAVFGDAFELTNVTHDLGRALLDSALREWKREHPCRNFELPLACRTDDELWKFRIQEFPGDTPHVYRLSEEQQRTKKELGLWMAGRSSEAALAATVFPVETEVFREVPHDRDYTVPPPGLKLHYDEWGRMQVARGKYQRPILFAEHFVPLVRQLPFMGSTP